MQRRDVKYQRCLIVYLDILGFKKRIESNSANHISHCIRMITEAVEPSRFKTKFPKLLKENFTSFSDLCVVWFPLDDKRKLPPSGWPTAQLLKLVHSQSYLAIDEGLPIRGGVTVGLLAESYGRIFGPGLIRAYELECKLAKYPRIIVDDCVIEELHSNPRVCMHDPETEKAYMLDMLRKDSDGLYFIDYLKVFESELDDPADYPVYLDMHRRFIDEQLEKFKDNPDVLPKYQWLDEYHNDVLQRLAMRPMPSQRDT